MIKYPQLLLLFCVVSVPISCQMNSKEDLEEVASNHHCTTEGCAVSSATESTEAAKFNDTTFEKQLTKIDTATLIELLKEKETILIDARVPKYTDGKQIPGAKSIHIKMPKEMIFKLLPKKDAPIITYCGDIHCPASLRLAMYLSGIGYTNLKEYPLGIDGWIEAGNPVWESNPHTESNHYDAP